MSDGDLDNSEFGREPRVSAEFVWSTLLVLALAGGVLLWAYLASTTHLARLSGGGRSCIFVWGLKASVPPRRVGHDPPGSRRLMF